MISAFITLGSNIEPEKNLPEAVRLLAEAITVRRVSRVYRSPAVDARGRINPAQADFLNAAVLAETDMTPQALKLDVLMEIERRLGRIRTEDKFAPRTIDLDLALYGRRVIYEVLRRPDGPVRLAAPDPDILRRAHVALPLADLDPAFPHPMTGTPLGEIAAQLAETSQIAID